MQRMFLKILAIVLLTNLAIYGQSLGEIARQYQEKLAAEEAAGAGPKKYTNQDIPPAQMQGTPEPSEQTRAVRPPAGVFPDRSEERRFAQQRAGEMWQRNIRMQENRVASLQARIDQLNAMIHSPAGGAQFEGPYNRYQAQAQWRLEQMGQVLDRQRQKLTDMQDAARHAGMESAVYDP
jgi:hypothetical protein